jgi:hypothetical protein
MGRRQQEIMKALTAHAQEWANQTGLGHTIWSTSDPLVPWYVKEATSPKRECRDGFTATPLVTILPANYFN